MPHSEITELIRKTRHGDSSAAEELVKRYKPLLQREVRLRLTGPQIRIYFDSEDLCQSIFASFFLRLSIGQYDLQDNRDLIGLLKRMVRNKVASRFRYHYAKQRDVRRVEHRPAFLTRDCSPHPEQLSTIKDLLEVTLSRLSPEMAGIARQRMYGETWEAITSNRAESADALRRRFDREIARVAEEMGLDD